MLSCETLESKEDSGRIHKLKSRQARTLRLAEVRSDVRDDPKEALL